MRAFFTAFVAIVSTPIQAAEPDPATLRARAALALAFAVPKPPTYAEAYARAVETGKPLVVFVGQPVREVSGCVCVGVESFPGARGERVVIGFPERKQLRRVDMPGRPSTDAIRAVVASPPVPGTAVLPAGF